jgi:hypothetical protein
VEEVLCSFMAPPYFPVTLKNVPASLEFATTGVTPLRVGDVTISSLRGGTAPGTRRCGPPSPPE